MVHSYGPEIFILHLKVFRISLRQVLTWDFPVFRGGQPILVDSLEQTSMMKIIMKYLYAGLNMEHFVLL